MEPTLQHIDLPVTDAFLYTLLACSFILCAFCAASETGLMSLNRYRLKHMAKTDPKAKRISQLLAQPDRLLGVILIGNTFATALGSSISNELAGRRFGDIGVLISPLIFTFFLLVIAESSPKTLAALKPEATARFVAPALKFMLWLLYPLVYITTVLSNALLRAFGIKVSERGVDSLTTEELRTVFHEAAGLIPTRHQNMLLSILDLEKVRVDHIMVPRNEVVGIDLDDDPDTIISNLTNTEHTLLPVYRSDLDNVLGILHTRKLAKILQSFNGPGGFNEKAILDNVDETYFVPEGTSLHMQLLNFQKQKRRVALVVDEYGDILGLVTLEDILEEIVGEFTTDAGSTEQEIWPEENGSFLVEGSISVRELNRVQHWNLPTEGPTTLSGLIIETFEALPDEGICVLIAGYPIEVVKMKDNTVKTARISPRLESFEARGRDH